MITLASQRYTIAALGSTLDSRYPGGGAGDFTPETGFTVSGVYADGGSVTIAKASGLGTKAQAAPIVWDMGSDVRINGTPNASHAELADGVAPTGVYTSGNDNVQITTTRAQRHARIDRHYATALHVGDANIGADNVLNAASAARKFFTAFRIRLPADPCYIDGVNFTDLTGTFREGIAGEIGEAVTIAYDGQSYTGWILAIGDVASGYGAGRLGLYSPTLVINSTTTPFTITGNESGATANCTTGGSYRALSSGKLWRINQEAADGILTVVQFANEQFWIESNATSVDSVAMNRTTYAPSLASVTTFPGWVYVEQFIDFSTTSAVTATLGVFGELGSDINTIPATDCSVNALNTPIKICSFGFDGSVEHPFCVDFGEFYADDTPQRVAICDSATYSSSTQVELCRVTAWSDTEISVSIYQGAHSSLTGKYLYIFNASNTPTLVGQFQ